MDFGALRMNSSGTESRNAPGAEDSSSGLASNTVTSIAALRSRARSMSSSDAHRPRGPAPIIATFITEFCMHPSLCAARRY